MPPAIDNPIIVESPTLPGVALEVDEVEGLGKKLVVLAVEGGARARLAPPVVAAAAGEEAAQLAALASAKAAEVPKQAQGCAGPFAGPFSTPRGSDEGSSPEGGGGGGGG